MQTDIDLWIFQSCQYSITFQGFWSYTACQQSHEKKSKTYSCRRKLQVHMFSFIHVYRFGSEITFIWKHRSECANTAKATVRRRVLRGNPVKVMSGTIPTQSLPVQIMLDHSSACRRCACSVTCVSSDESGTGGSGQLIREVVLRYGATNYITANSLSPRGATNLCKLTSQLGKLPVGLICCRNRICHYHLQAHRWALPAWPTLCYILWSRSDNFSAADGSHSWVARG